MKNLKNTKRFNKKGFTLVELLAVIVILAVLIMLALPNVMNIMENARKSAFETEVKSYLKAAQTKYTEKVTEGVSGTTMVFTNSGTDNNSCTVATPCKVDIDGDYTYSITVTSSGTDGAKYTYTINNGTYKAENNNVKYNAEVTVNPVDGEEASTAA